MIRFSATIIIISSIFICLSVAIATETNSSLSELERFSKYPLEKQKEILSKDFQKRMEFAKNLFYRNKIYCGGQEIINSKDTSTGKKSVRRDYAHWQLNNDYKYEISFFDSNREKASQWSTACWDSKEGIQKSTVKNESLDRTFARIDTVFESALLLNNSYSFWLQGGSSAEFPIPPYLFPHVLKHQNEWNIVSSVNEHKVQLIVPYDATGRLSAVQSQKGEITLFLDPNKYFIPVQGTLRGDVLLEDGRKIWREETFEVEESKLINDIWMPFQLTIRVRTSIRPDFISVTNIVITEMEQGKVTKKDVTFHFPEGTEVTDAIKGVSYKTDANGKPIESTIQPLYGLDPSHVKLPEPPKRKINIVFIVAGILLIVTALYLQFRKRRNKD